MSWIVSTLLMDSSKIKAEHDFDSDDYNNLLIIERKIEDLKNGNCLSDEENRILSLIQEGYILKDIEKMLGIGRSTVSKIFSSLCNRISYSLGGEFTNDGYISGVVRRNHLTQAEEDKLREFVNSNLRHRILRRALK